MGGKKPPRHGEYSGYTTMGCRLACCRAAATRYNKRYRLRSLNGPTMVSSIGALRRVRALAAMGWPMIVIAAEAGVGYGGTFNRLSQRPLITRAYHDRLAAAYDRLQAIPGPSEKARRYAASQGWAPTFAWDENIDDPEAVPDFGAPAHSLDLDEWWFLVQAGESPERAAERCGVTLSAVSGAAYRAGRNELANLAETARKHRRVSA